MGTQAFVPAVYLWNRRITSFCPACAFASRKKRLMQHFGIMLAVFGLISFCQVSFFSDCDFDFVKYCKPRLPYLWTRPVIGSVEYKIWSQTLCGFKKETFWCGHFIERKLILMHKAVLWIWDEKLQFGYHSKLS